MTGANQPTPLLYRSVLLKVAITTILRPTLFIYMCVDCVLMTAIATMCGHVDCLLKIAISIQPISVMDCPLKISTTAPDLARILH